MKYLSFNIQIYSQNINTLHFTDYGYEQGLTINPVDIILQDKAGYVWFGSKFGLCRYDGYEFVTYTHESENDNSLTHSHITSLVEDNDGNLWVGTPSGLNKIDRARETIKHIQISEEQNTEPIHSLYFDEEDQLWIGSNNNLINLDVNSEIINTYPIEFNISNHEYDVHIHGITGDRYDQLWLQIGNVLIRFNKITYSQDSIFKTPIQEGYLEQPVDEIMSTTIYDIVQAKDGILWIGTWGGGLTKFNPLSGEYFTYPFHYQYVNMIHKTVNKIHEDEQGVLWLATDNGLFRFNPKYNTLLNDRFPGLHEGSLSSNFIRSVYQERSGAMWIATDTKLHRYEPTQNPFQFLIHNPHDPNTISANPVYSMCEGLDGIIYFGTHLGGLNAYDPVTNTFKSYQNDPNDLKSIPDNTITALHTNNDGKIWVGTWTQGLCLFDPQTESFKRFPHTSDITIDPYGELLVGTTVRTIEVVSNGDVWIGTEDYTITIYQPDTGKFRYIVDELPNPYTPDHRSIYKIFEDSNKQIWIGTGSYGESSPGMGLYRYAPELDSFQFNDLRAGEDGIWGVKIPDIIDDKEDGVWLATHNGLSFFDYKQDQYINYYPTDGFWGEVTESVLQVENGNIWVSTKDFGLSMLNPNSGQVLNFGENEGLNNLNFLSGSALKAKDGTLYFGGMRGVTILPNGQIPANKYIPPVQIQKCFVLDNLIPNVHIQNQFIPTLSYWQNSLRFDYTSLNFTSPSKNRYQYRLIGLDDRWVDATDHRSVTYSYLPPGSYTFEVKGSNNDGIWNDTPKTFNFVIAPPFWQTWLFRFAVISFVIFIIMAVFYWRIKAIRARNKYLEDQVELRTVSLQREKEHSEDILNKSPAIIFGFTMEGKMTFINPAGRTYLNVLSDEVNKKKWWEIFPNPNDHFMLKEIHEKVRIADVVDHETVVTLLDNDKRTLIWNFIRHVDDFGSVFDIIAFGNDVTEKIEHEILEASSREQRNIGREIHDSICQSLTGIYCLNETISRNQEDPSSPNAQLIERMKQHIQDVTVQSRNIARSLYLHELEHDGLKKAFQELTKKIESLFHVKCSFITESDIPTYDIHTSTHLYRIAQEAINNAVKYSEADEVILRIQNSNNRLALLIEDKGKGFTQKTVSNKGMGMNIMKYRARMIKAELSIESQPGNGTTVRCIID